MLEDTFQPLIQDLRQPTKPANLNPSWPYPLPEAEMIPGYGLRPLTPAEQTLFPGLRLALHIDKVQLIKPPASVTKARAGWIVWLAETYPGAYLMRLPGGATLPVPYNLMVWEKVPAETAVTTLEAVRAEEQRRLEEAQKWQTGQTVTTRGTRLSFNSLTRWIAGWQQTTLAPAVRRGRPEPLAQRWPAAPARRLQGRGSPSRALCAAPDPRSAPSRV